MGIIFSRFTQARTNTNAVRKLPSVQREASRSNFKKAKQTEEKRFEEDIQQKDNQPNILEKNNKNTKQEILRLNTQIKMLNEQKERIIKQVRQKELTYYESINNIETSINQAQKQIEELENELQKNVRHQEIDKLRNKYSSIGLQCTYQNATKKIGTGGDLLGKKSDCPFTVNPKSSTLYQIPAQSVINLVEYYPPVINDEDYKLNMYAKVRDYNDNTSKHKIYDGKHTISAPIISVDIKRSGSIDFTTYDNEGNEIDSIHKDKHGAWN